MAACTNCGSPLKDGARFCPNCGTAAPAPAVPELVLPEPIGQDTAPNPAWAGSQAPQAPEPPAGEQAPNPQPTQAPPQQSYAPPVYTPPQPQYVPPQPTVRFDPADVADNKVLSIFCYFGLFMLIPLIASPDSRFVRYHCNQGLCVLLLALILSVCAIVPVLGWLVAGVGYVFVVVIEIIGIVRALRGEAAPLPLVGKYTVLKY